METLIQIETKNYQKVKEMLLKDDVVSRASIVFKEAKLYRGKDGYYCYITGLEEQCKKALEIVKQKDQKTGNVVELAKEVTGKEKEEFVKKIKDEEERAMEGFGNIFG